MYLIPIAQAIASGDTSLLEADDDVPEHLRCKACRQRNLRCDSQPEKCMICTYLKIKCIRPEPRSQESSLAILPHRGGAGIPHQPFNQTMRARQSFAFIFRTDDVRHSPSIFGDFLREVPRRLGRSAALDASANALVQAYQGFQRRDSASPSLLVLSEYNNALRALRIGLDDVEQSSSIETLCAIYLLITFTGDTMMSAHGAGLAHLLHAATVIFKDSQDPFINQLLLSLCVPVIYEAIFNPRIQLEPWLSQLSAARDAAIPIKSLRFGEQSKLRGYITDPASHELEIRQLYQQCGADANYIVKLLLRQPPSTPKAVIVNIRSVLCLVFSYSIVLLTVIVRHFEPQSRAFLDEAAELVNKMLTMARDSAQFRPFGASIVPTMLMCAWPVAGARRAEIEALIEEYAKDFPKPCWQDCVRGLDYMLENQQQAIVAGEIALTDRAQMEQRTANMCSVM